MLAVFSPVNHVVVRVDVGLDAVLVHLSRQLRDILALSGPQGQELVRDTHP